MYKNKAAYSSRIDYPRKPADSKAFREYKKLMNQISKEKETQQDSVNFHGSYEMLSPKFYNIPTEESDR